MAQVSTEGWSGGPPSGAAGSAGNTPRRRSGGRAHRAAVHLPRLCTLMPTRQNCTPLQGILTISDSMAPSCLTLRAKLHGIRGGRKSGCIFIRDTWSIKEKDMECHSLQTILTHAGANDAQAGGRRGKASRCLNIVITVFK